MNFTSLTVISFSTVKCYPLSASYQNPTSLSFRSCPLLSFCACIWHSTVHPFIFNLLDPFVRGMAFMCFLIFLGGGLSLCGPPPSVI